VRNLVHMQGGTVQASSAGRAGKRIRGALPRVASQGAAEMPLRSLSSASSFDPVVDDHPTPRKACGPDAGVGHSRPSRTTVRGHRHRNSFGRT